MTEAEWLAGTDPRPMLQDLAGRASARKLRLFACAFLRQVWQVVGGQGRAVEVAERYADGLADDAELAAARAAPDSDWSWYASEQELTLISLAIETTDPDPLVAAVSAADVAVHGAGRPGIFRTPEEEAEDRARDARHTAALLRCLFGNPFRPVSADPSWMPANAVVLARTMYESRDFAAMPLLADLLEEAGFPADVGRHCRAGGPHARGCWVLDLVLGRESP
jgi:hypothetical protein